MTFSMLLTEVYLNCTLFLLYQYQNISFKYRSCWADTWMLLRRQVTKLKFTF